MSLTNGPWKAVFGSDNETGNHPAEIIGSTGHPIAYVLRPTLECGGSHVENARLLAASRELLGACKMIDSAYASPPVTLHAKMDEAVRTMRLLIASIQGNPAE